MFTDASSRTQSRTQSIKPLMKRLRNATSAPVYAEVKLAYTTKPSGVSLLRDIVSNVASSIPSSQQFVDAAQRATKRTQMVELLVSMLEAAGHDQTNRFTGGSSAMAPSLPYGRGDPGAVVSNQLQQLAAVQPPFPYSTRMPEGALVQPLHKVEYTQRLGVVSPSLVQGRVLCPREPEVAEVDGIFIVNGIKHVRDFYSGNVIHVRLPGHKFKDGADKCQYFSVLREAFDQYRREYAAHSNPSDPWWGRRRVMTNWTVYLDEGIDAFDEKPAKDDQRTILDNDMTVVDLKDANGAAVMAAATTATIQKKSHKAGIPICVTRFDGRDNIGHTRSVTMMFYPQGVSPAAGAAPQDPFTARNLLRFMYKTDDYQVFYQDWFSHEVRRMIISDGTGAAYDEANRRANERSINFLKADQRNALFVVDQALWDVHNKEINRAIKSVNDFCRQGREGYERLAVVIVSTGATVSIDSEVATSRKTYISAQNTALNWLLSNTGGTANAASTDKDATAYNAADVLLAPVAQVPAPAAGGAITTTARPNILQLIDVDSEAISHDGSNVVANVKTVKPEFRLQFDQNPAAGFPANLSSKIHLPLMRLVRFSPQQGGFFQLVQKRSMAQQQSITEPDRNNIFIEQIAKNKPIYVDEQVLAGFTNPDMGRYMVTASNPDSDLFVQRVSKFELIGAGTGQPLFVKPKHLPTEFFNYLRNAASDPIVIVGVQQAAQAGNCINENVEMFCQKNGVPVDMLDASKFQGVTPPDEYVFIRTQVHKATNTVIMFQYKFNATNAAQLKVVQKLYNASDLDDIPAGWTFLAAAQDLI